MKFGLLYVFSDDAKSLYYSANDREIQDDLKIWIVSLTEYLKNATCSKQMQKGTVQRLSKTFHLTKLKLAAPKYLQI